MSDESSEKKGRAKGGEARAKSLSKEERSAIAKKAAQARHNKPLPKATHKGILKIGDAEIPCFVLNDGRRVISGRGLTSAIGMKGRGQGVGRISTLKAVKLSQNNNLPLAIEKPILFLGESPKVGQPSDGFEATVLQELCEALLEARDAGVLVSEHERRYAREAEILIRSFARLGIVALIDEATGFQSERPKDALQQYLEMLVHKELAVWAKKFPDEFYENIYKIRGWVWPGIGKNRYSVVAHYTRDLVYERMAPGLLNDLETKTPKDENGHRSARMHQWLTGDIGDPMLASHLQSILTLQRLAIANGWGWTKFMSMVDQVMKKKGDSIDLPFAEQ
jgi:hypothetical protein